MSQLIDLRVPYFSQRDNQLDPGGSCNVTSVAMCMAYLGIVGDGSGRQLEDQCNLYLKEQGLSRHNPEHLVLLFRWKGLADRFSYQGTWKQALEHLAEGLPVIVHGEFTASGHIMVIRGWDPVRQEWIVNDPAGEWQPGRPYGNYGSWQTPPAGNGSRFKFATMDRLCSPEGPGHVWLHRPRRPGRK